MGCSNGSCSTSSRYVPTAITGNAIVAGEECHCGGTCGGCSGDGHSHAPSGVVAGTQAGYVPHRAPLANRPSPCFSKGQPRVPRQGFHGGPVNAPQVDRGSINDGAGSSFRPSPRLPAPPPVQRMSSVPRTNIGEGGEASTRTAYIPPPVQQNGVPGKIPARATDAPIMDVPRATVIESKTPAPITVIGLIPVGQSNPFSPYCGNGIDPASELCRAASAAGVSDYCRDELLRFLKSGSQMSLAEWIGAQELCDKDTLRAAAGLAASTIATKASQGLYNRSGGLPNYHRPSGLTAAEMAAQDAELDRLVGPRQALASDWTHGGAANLGFGGEGGDLYVPPPASPPVDYGALVAGIGTAVGASLSGINALVNTANQSRLRELEIEYANQSRGAELALRRSAMEIQAEIARLGATGTPAATATVNAMNSELSDLRARLQAMTAENDKMGTGTMVALGLGGLAALGAIAYFATRGGRRSNPSRKARR